MFDRVLLNLFCRFLEEPWQVFVFVLLGFFFFFFAFCRSRGRPNRCSYLCSYSLQYPLSFYLLSFFLAWPGKLLYACCICDLLRSCLHPFGWWSLWPYWTVSLKPCDMFELHRIPSAGCKWCTDFAPGSNQELVCLKYLQASGKDSFFFNLLHFSVFQTLHSLEGDGCAPSVHTLGEGGVKEGGKVG